MPRPPPVPRLGAVDDPPLSPPQTPGLRLGVADKVLATDLAKRLVDKLLLLHLSLWLITLVRVTGNFVIVGTTTLPVDSV